MSLPSSKLPVRWHQGVSLIEMLVVMAIFTIMTAVVMANLPAFRSRTSLDLLAEEVAITIRQAQVFGVGTRVFGPQYPSHGVYFDLTESASDNPSFILFGDANNSGVYDDDPNSDDCVGECREEFLFRGGVGITKLEGYSGSECTTPTSLQKLEILFHRPEADAFFTPNDNFCYVKLVLSSVRNSAEGNREVRVWNTGHIYACNPRFDSCS